MLATLKSKNLDFYVKWLATFSSLFLVFLTSHDVTPLNKYFGLLAASLWMTLGVLWREPSMWLTNAIFAAIYITGIL